MHTTTRRLLTAAAAITAAATLTTPAHASPTPPTAPHTPAYTAPRVPKAGDTIDGKKVQAVTQAKLLYTRKATAEDVASGFAASLAATVYGCNDSTPLDSPYTHARDPKLGLSVGWEESKVTGSGRPEARIKAGNAIFVFNNHTVTSRADVYWTYTDWNNYNGGSDVLYAYAATTPQFSVYIPYGSSSGEKVNADGTITNTPWSTFKTSSSAWGFRQFVEFYGSSEPRMRIVLTTDGATHVSHTSDVRIYADGNCGSLILF